LHNDAVRRLLQHVEQSIRDRRLLGRGQAVLVAVSGGVDSMVLLHLLHGLAAKQGWQLTVAHFNHQLRGRQSDADERLVRLAAKRLGLRLVRGGADVRQHARTHKLSLEMAGRELRHKFLARTARRLRIPAVALAHQADDQVELFFLRLLRGAGGEGLQGMKGRSRSPADGEIELVRPLLDLTKADLQAHARREGIPFREDASNGA
jgi:tRNA(Ile)-lysidine synthase